MGAETTDGYRYLRCRECSLVYIDPLPRDIEAFYQTDAYRLRFDRTNDARNLQQSYDHEQAPRVARIGIENLRGRDLADFGAGAGLFLDVVRGVCRRTIAVEPAEAHAEYLRACGHDVYRYAEQLCAAGHKVDIVTSFDVIEHVTDPLGLLRCAYDVLRPGGTLYLSMINHDDLLRTLLPAAYESFFYQIAHVAYFDARSIASLLARAGFSAAKIDYLHKYTIDNLLQWALEQAPGSFDSNGVFDRAFADVYRIHVERLGRASHLFVTARKPDSSTR